MRLVILRHAKSARPPGIDDFDRPLCDRGKHDAPLIGSWMRARAIEPALVLCSPARRAKETLELILPLVNPQAEFRFDPELYLAEAAVLMQRLRAAPPVSPLMLVGHNPGLHDLGASLLARRQPAYATTRLAEYARKLPTAALVILDFKSREWRNLRAGSAILTEFIRPKTLPAQAGDEAQS